jgi:hypothetical protein
MAAPKATFIRSQMRKGRSKAQAESDWKASRRMKAKARAKKNPSRPAKRKPSTRKKNASRPARKKKASRKRSNPMGAASVPVLLMNPAQPKRRKSAVARKRRRKVKRRRRRNPAKKFDLAGVAVAAVGGAATAGGTFLLDGTELSLPAQYGIVGAGGALLGAGLSRWAPNLAKGMAGGGVSIAALGFLRHYLTPPLGEKAVAANKLTPVEETKGLSAVRRMAAQGAQNKAVVMRAVRAKLGCTKDSCEACASWDQCPMSHYMGRRRMPQASARMSAIRAPLQWGSQPSYNMGAVQANLQGVNVHQS